MRTYPLTVFLIDAHISGLALTDRIDNLNESKQLTSVLTAVCKDTREGYWVGPKQQRQCNGSFA